MDIAFVWNDVEFEARIYVDDYCLWISQLWLVSDKVKVDVTNLLQDMELSEKLNTVAEEIYEANVQLERAERHAIRDTVQ